MGTSGPFELFGSAAVFKDCFSALTQRGTHKLNKRLGQMSK